MKHFDALRKRRTSAVSECKGSWAGVSLAARTAVLESTPRFCKYCIYVCRHNTPEAVLTFAPALRTYLRTHLCNWRLQTVKTPLAEAQRRSATPLGTKIRWKDLRCRRSWQVSLANARRGRLEKSGTRVRTPQPTDRAHSLSMDGATQAARWSTSETCCCLHPPVLKRLRTS